MYSSFSMNKVQLSMTHACINDRKGQGDKNGMLFFKKQQQQQHKNGMLSQTHTHTQLDAASSATLLPIIGRQGILLKEAKPQTGTAKIKIPEGL
jgi:hypothetical protein